MRIIGEVEVCELVSRTCGKLRAMFDSGASGSLVKRSALLKAIPQARLGGVEPPRPVEGIVGDEKPTYASEAAMLTFRVGGTESLPGAYLVVEHMKTVDIIVGADQLENNDIELVFRKAPKEGAIRFTSRRHGIVSGTFEVRPWSPR